MARRGRPASALTQNCSGNHAGMLAASVAAGWPTEGYTRADHPVQQAIAATTARLAGGVSPDVAVDGCGAPAFGTTVAGLARAYAALGGAAAGHARGPGARRGPGPPVAASAGPAGATPASWARCPASRSRTAPTASSPPGGPTRTGRASGWRSRCSTAPTAGRGVLLAEGMRRAGLDVPPTTDGVTDPVLGHGEPVGAVVSLPWG